MARRNLFAKLNNPSSDIPLRPFDLSQRKVFSARAGMCIPTLALTCVKGDKFKIDSTIFNRTDRLLAPSFFRCKQFHHFFFNPFAILLKYKNFCCVKFIKNHCFFFYNIITKRKIYYIAIRNRN